MSLDEIIKFMFFLDNFKFLKNFRKRNLYFCLPVQKKRGGKQEMIFLLIEIFSASQARGVSLEIVMAMSFQVLLTSSMCQDLTLKGPQFVYIVQ